MTIIKQARDCRISDFILYKNEESHMITNLAGENSLFDSYDAPDEVNVWGTQEALF